MRMDLNWKPSAIGDLNRDGRADLTWYNLATGETSAWLMDRTRVSDSASLLTDFPHGR